MRTIKNCLLAALAGYGVFFVAAAADSAGYRRKDPKYKDDLSAEKAWGIIGAVSAVFLFLSRPIWMPVVRVAHRHPRLTALVSAWSVFAYVMGCLDKVEHRLGTSSMGSSPSLRKKSGGYPLPAAADDVLGIGPTDVGHFAPKQFR